MVFLGHISFDGSKFLQILQNIRQQTTLILKPIKKLKHEIEKLLKKAEKCDEKEDKIYYNGKGYSIPDELKIKGSRLEKIKKVKKELEKRKKRRTPKEKLKAKSR